MVTSMISSAGAVASRWSLCGICLPVSICVRHFSRQVFEACLRVTAPRWRLPCACVTVYANGGQGGGDVGEDIRLEHRCLLACKQISVI